MGRRKRKRKPKRTSQQNATKTLPVNEMPKPADMDDEDWEFHKIDYPGAHKVMREQYAALQAGARSAPTKPEDETNRQYDKRVQSALDHLRQVAEARGQNVRDFVPCRLETPATTARPASPATELQARGATVENCTTPAPTAAQQPPSVRGVLLPWTRRWIIALRSNTSGGQNMAQRIVLIVGFLVILVMALFPPWVYVFSPPAELRDHFVRAERPAGYHFMFSDHSPQDESQLYALFNLRPTADFERRALSLHLFSVRLDTSRLQVQIAVALLLIVILFFALRGIQKPATR